MTPVNPPPKVAPRRIPSGGVCECDLRPFVAHYICIWLKNRRRLWFCPAAVDPERLTGYIWLDNKWAPIVLSLKMIDSFY